MVCALVTGLIFRGPIAYALGSLGFRVGEASLNLMIVLIAIGASHAVFKLLEVVRRHTSFEADLESCDEVSRWRAVRRHLELPAVSWPTLLIAGLLPIRFALPAETIERNIRALRTARDWLSERDRQVIDYSIQALSRSQEHGISASGLTLTEYNGIRRALYSLTVAAEREARSRRLS